MKKEMLERKVLLLATRNTVIIVLLYVFYDLFFHDDPDRIKGGLLAFFIFLSCYWLLAKRFSKTTKRLTAAIFLLSNATGFFSQGGLASITAIDFCGLILVFPIVFGGMERSIFISIVLLQIVIFGYIQIVYPDLISDFRGNDHPIVKVLEVVVRFANLLHIVYIYRGSFDQEQAKLFHTSRNLEVANKRISNHNKNLERTVDERTRTIRELNKKLIEYAFFNSHKVRGPLARILGLIHLIEMASPENEQQNFYETNEFINRLAISAHELDKVVKEINLILDDVNERVSEE